MTDVGREGRVVRVGGLSREQLVGRLRDAGVGLNAHAETLLAHPDFDDPTVRSLRLVERTVRQLGLPDGGTQSHVFAAALGEGLALAPLVAGPYLRLALTDQQDAPDSVLSAGRAPAGSIHVASAPVTDDVDHPRGFYLRVVDGRAWLRGYRCDDSYAWGPEQRLAFVLPQGS